MLRLLSSNPKAKWLCIRYLASNHRKQNFFELNPIYPDFGSKDFDIYNGQKKHIPILDVTNRHVKRYWSLKQKVQKEFLEGKYRKLEALETEEPTNFDETGLPIGLNQHYDAFIENYKRQDKLGTNIQEKFQELQNSLIKSFSAKSEAELIKIFRISIASVEKKNFKDKIRGVIMNEALIKLLHQKNYSFSEFSQKPNLTKEEIADLIATGGRNIVMKYNLQQKMIQKQNSQQKAKEESTELQKIKKMLALKDEVQPIKLEDLEEGVFRATLKYLDEEIQKVQRSIKEKAQKNGRMLPRFHPVYGEKYEETNENNKYYDINFDRGMVSQSEINRNLPESHKNQDFEIENRINKLYFARQLEMLSNQEELSIQEVIKLNELPKHIRNKDKIINGLIYKYKELDLLEEPDLEDIYAEIDIALSKVGVRITPDLLRNQKEHNQQEHNKSNQHDALDKERIYNHHSLVWEQLDLDEIFDADSYSSQDVSSVVISEKRTHQISPSADMELSLNKLPLNLFRHSEFEIFGVFNKYRSHILRDYIKDVTVDTSGEFPEFSLETAKQKLQQVKREAQILEEVVMGYGKRKSSEAEVYIRPGSGKVVINGEPIASYFDDLYHRGQALKPLIYTNTSGKYDLNIEVVGGGNHGQSECISIALTNGLIKINPEYREILYQIGLVGTDDRKKEPKRMGLYSARKRPPYVRR